VARNLVAFRTNLNSPPLRIPRATIARATSANCRSVAVLCGAEDATHHGAALPCDALECVPVHCNLFHLGGIFTVPRELTIERCENKLA
jgi:hypothetical protein